MPLRENEYTSKTLFPFFDGLIPEGWLLQIAIKNWKLSNKDWFGLLLATCKDCIGDIVITEEEDVKWNVYVVIKKSYTVLAIMKKYKMAQKMY